MSNPHGNTTPSSPETSPAHLDAMTASAPAASNANRANTSHRKRLARRLAEATGSSYAQALVAVRRAAEDGRLPSPLDDAGMQRALVVLTTEREAPSSSTTSLGEPTAAPDPEPCHAARTGEGYWTCDQHGCADCRTLALELDDRDQITEWDAERREAAQADDPNLHLEPAYLRLVRMARQGRVTKEPLPSGKAARWVIDNRPASSTQSTDLVLLERDGYLTAPLPVGDEWVIARTTDFGDQVLAANGADRDKFHDGLPDAVVDDEPDRRPHVGEGADGARRSAEIDRSEADGFDADDPRRAERLASAQRWERQAEGSPDA